EAGAEDPPAHGRTLEAAPGGRDGRRSGRGDQGDGQGVAPHRRSSSPGPRSPPRGGSTSRKKFTNPPIIPRMSPASINHGFVPKRLSTRKPIPPKASIGPISMPLICAYLTAAP